MSQGFDIAKYFIQKKSSSWLFAILLVLGGVISYLELGQLEDPEFAIKQAIVVTMYPGASPEQVEEEVTYPLENEIQKLPYVDFIKSVTTKGRSQITLTVKPIYRSADLPQIWDELRRKINDFQPNLPSGTLPPIINDDFGDVFGVLLAVTGDGFEYDEINDYVDFIRRELVLVDGVGKVTVEGKQQEQVIIEISHNKMISLGLSTDYIYQILAQQNVVSNAGSVRIGNEDIRFHPTGEFQSVQEMGNLIVSPPGQQQRIKLSDIAKIYRDFSEQPTHIVNHNGKQAIYVGVSFASGSNVVEVGQVLTNKLTELEQYRPYGINLDTIYNQPLEVETSINGFIESLAQAVIIVIIILLIFMGVKTGLLIGGILLATVLGTFIFMELGGWQLHRVSLGALIIALGMLVDNAIVVVEGVLIGMKRGLSKLESASLIVRQTKWPLLAATFIAIIAFAPIGLSPDATGEFASSLFYVLAISLLLSWVTAITITPFFADMLFKQQASKQEQGNEDDVYQAGVYRAYKSWLKLALKMPKLTMLGMALLFVLAVYGFQFTKQAFFPSSNLPIFYVDYRAPMGSDIRATAELGEQLEQKVMALDDVEFVSATVGRGATRFMLTYQVELGYSNYGQLIVRMKDKNDIVPAIAKVREIIQAEFPAMEARITRVDIGPPAGSKIEARFSGPDPVVLRQLSEQAKAIFKQDPGTLSVMDDWKNMTKIIRPIFNADAARAVGITKSDIDTLLLTNYKGRTVGVYRDGTERLPILVRLPADERKTINTLEEMQIYSPVLGQYLPIKQVVSEFKVEYENPIIKRRDRKRVITAMADNDILSDETAEQVFARVKDKVEAIELPNGYEMVWGGEYEQKNKAQGPIFGALPLGFGLMFVITVLLFNSFKLATVIWTTVPLAVIGVSFGFVVSGIPFGFMSLLGLLSLSGMLIKNGIVLVEQIKIEREEGRAHEEAIVHASVSRVRPVSMAAITTVLGMIPLLGDDFFKSMAVVIMAGLSFATILTLIVVPVMYSLMIKPDEI